MDTKDYITSVYQKQKEQFPYITTTHLKSFAVKIPSLRVSNHRDLKFVRRLFFKESSDITDEDKILLDACFPADLGPFANHICSTLLPKTSTVSRRRLAPAPTPSLKQESGPPSRLEQQQLISVISAIANDDIQVLTEKMSMTAVVGKSTSLPLTTSEETLIDEEEEDAEETLAREIVGKEMKLSLEVLQKEMEEAHLSELF